MWAGWGSGQKEFIGYGADIECQHCHNRVVEQVWATYSYEEWFVIKLKYLGGRGSDAGDGDIIFMCPTCTYGFRVQGLEAAAVTKKELANNYQGAASAAQFAIEAEHQLQAAQARFSIPHTKNWIRKQNPIKRISYFKMLRRLGLVTLAMTLDK